MIASIAKWGNSAAIRLPKKILDALSLHIGDQVNIVQRGRSVVIEPCKPSLDDLLARVTPQNRHEEVFTGQAGHELL
ncbi:AbrB/MazE/SpoVT family DNA-binding domain-containing protein [Nitrosococcus watsonii]|uniref:Transcriptional regulator/antitoxin, MazE n=1 Tax=Nitrosococcus watsoni (strain C-113) TaxID=105559 RepID=D8K9Y4_NITWC|nr:AbrB/MazE/SpoVT family DNA-binding domain-containing protein [Nitrosococcus watsonii]ADJ29342.1 transcriptional regulator/antitoxin, MazE [Nitrosococcus watsonii C-113]